VTVFNLWLANVQVAQTVWEANIVIASRLMRLASGGGLAQREAQRMILEKITANAEAQMAAALKMMKGGGVISASKSASAVYRRKVRANKRRLTSR
jgi:hypothetical protein